MSYFRRGHFNSFQKGKISEEIEDQTLISGAHTNDLKCLTLKKRTTLYKVLLLYNSMRSM